MDLDEIRMRAESAEQAWKLLPPPPAGAAWPDVPYLAASAADVPHLVAEVERLRDVAAALEAENDHLSALVRALGPLVFRYVPVMSLPSVVVVG